MLGKLEKNGHYDKNLKFSNLSKFLKFSNLPPLREFVARRWLIWCRVLHSAKMPSMGKRGICC